MPESPKITNLFKQKNIIKFAANRSILVSDDGVEWNNGCGCLLYARARA